jgi:hypothetical protein
LKMPSESQSPEPVRRLIELLVPAFRKALEADPVLRQEVRGALEALLASPLFSEGTGSAAAAAALTAVVPPDRSATTAPVPAGQGVQESAASKLPTVSVDPGHLQSLLQEGQLGAGARTVPVPTPVRHTYTGPRLKELGRRFLLKARACRRITEIQLDPDAPAGPIELRELLAVSDGAKLWMHGTSHHAASAAEWLETAEAFDLTGRIVTAAAESGDPGTGPSGPAWLQLMASSQCVLRNAVSRSHRVTDEDQVHLHGYLKAAAFEHQYLLRHLRLKDVLTATEVPRLEAVLAGLVASTTPKPRPAVAPAKERAKRLQYHARRLAGTASDQDDSERAHHVDVIADAIRALEAEGVAPSDALFAPLIPLDPALWEACGQGAVIADLLRRRSAELAAADDSSEEETAEAGEESPDAPSRQTPEMNRIRKLLEGRTLLLIGGDPQPRRIQAYIKAFNLTGVEWPETRHYQSNERLTTLIERADVAVVAVAIRWASHSRSELRQVVQRAGKPWVVLERGLNPAQFASALIEQCSEHPAFGGSSQVL